MICSNNDHIRLTFGDRFRLYSTNEYQMSHSKKVKLRDKKTLESEIAKARHSLNVINKLNLTDFPVAIQVSSKVFPLKQLSSKAHRGHLKD